MTVALSHANGSRFREYDFAKGVMIVLMVNFHQDWAGLVGQHCVGFRSISVSFFLPIFFFLSGYFTSPPASCTKAAWTDLRRIGSPYLSFALLYIALVALARQTGLYPIRQEFPLTEPTDWLRALLLSPITPYYYLYAILLFRLSYYVVLAVLPNNPSGRWCLHLSLLIASEFLGIRISHWGILLLGLFAREMQLRIAGERWAAIPVAAILVGCLITQSPVAQFLGRNPLLSPIWFLSILSVTLWAWRVADQRPVARLFEWLGRNSLAILVMHVFFLKAALLLFNWTRALDPTGVLHLTLGMLVGTLGPIGGAWVLDAVGFSRIAFGTARAYRPWESAAIQHASLPVSDSSSRANEISRVGRPAEVEGVDSPSQQLPEPTP